MTLAKDHSQPHAAPRSGNRARPALSMGLLVIWGAFCGPGGNACAQSIVAPASQSITHDGSDAPQVFPEVVWQLHSALDPLGYTAQWSCGPFTHSGQASFKADTKLTVRVLASGASANWTVVAPDDQTNIASGDQTAAVAAQSVQAGDGQAGLTVNFVDSDFSRLGAGEYAITVTGTIMAN